MILVNARPFHKNRYIGSGMRCSVKKRERRKKNARSAFLRVYIIEFDDIHTLWNIDALEIIDNAILLQHCIF